MATTYAIPDGRVAMAATLYTGTGASLAVANTVNGVNFQPDLVWVKGRSGATDHAWYDVVRGVQLQLESNTTTAETTETTGLTAFGSTGFTVGALAQMNTSAATYVAWQWKAGGTAVTNTAGSITSSVSANPTAGFSIVTYTGTGANATVGHGLGVAPSMIILFPRNNIGFVQPVWHTSLGGSTDSDYLAISNTGGRNYAGALTGLWNSTAPTSSVFSIGSSVYSNTSTKNYVAYCFAAVAGYSAFGSYTGNGSADGPFVYTGFRPRWVMAKLTSGADRWGIVNSASSPYNEILLELHANNADAEGGAGQIDFTSTGFKMRSNNSVFNSSGGTYIYMAFAENPFKYANAR